ncbi:hypothetical protein BDV28DRAFT_51149 [Aspergillus coremiiformis]|uniref:Uncharacterized protein n=1 Tax=Aspergillus coremiiformis TaxID=138285 RepID=A0A5N6ZGM8_9EURO|nr:hypothetical protein BDV28DRAFT_51149 [Aspergillus coremiiformis]
MKALVNVTKAGIVFLICIVAIPLVKMEHKLRQLPASGTPARPRTPEKVRRYGEGMSSMCYWDATVKIPPRRMKLHMNLLWDS